MDNYEFARDIVSIVFPTLIGAYTSNKITSSWQLKKEKFKLREQILQDYQKSIITHFKLLTNFAEMINRNYISQVISDPSSPSGYKLEFSIPEDKDNQPYQKYFNEYLKLGKELGDANKETWNFYATVELYYDNKELEKELGELTSKQSIAYWSFEKFIRSKNTVEYVENYAKVNNDLKNLNTTIHQFRRSMINSKIRKSEI